MWLKIKKEGIVLLLIVIVGRPLYAKTPIVKRSNSSLRIQRKKSSQPQKSPADQILFLQRTIGNQAVRD